MPKQSQPTADDFDVDMLESLNSEAVSKHDSNHETIEGRMDVDQLECWAKTRDIRNDHAH